MTKLLIVFIACNLMAAEKKVKLESLPAAVQQTIREQAKAGKLAGVTSEVENGKTVYEAELKVDGHGRDVTVDSSGAVLAVEEEVPLASIPAAAKAAIEKQAAKGKITKVETITKNGLVTYEAAISHGLKKSEVVVNADGSPAKE